MADPLSESAALARMALDASGAGAWSWDAASDRITVDDRYRALYGFGRDETVTLASWQSRLMPEDRDELRRRVEQCLSAGEHWHDEFRIAHPTAGLRWLEGYGRVVRDAGGRVVGLVGVNLDVTQRIEAAEALRSSETHLKAVFDGAIDAILTIDGDGIIRSCNRAAAKLFGYDQSWLVGRNVSLLMPDPHRSAHDGYLRAYLETGVAKIIGIGREVTGRRSDGSLVPIDLGISEIREQGRRLFVGVVRDISERKQAEATQALLLQELNHRVKNTLATVQSMAEQTLRHTDDPRLFVEAFRGRLQALSRSHDLLTRRTWHGVGIHALIGEQLLIVEGLEAQITLDGPDVQLAPQLAVHLGLVLHELGTNARKYGALSVPGGRLVVSWEQSTADEPQRRLALTWRESGAPAYAAPGARGFGMTLVERGIRHTLRGDVRLDFAPGGLVCTIAVPL